MDNYYKKYYSEGSFRDKLQRSARKAGAKVVYAALLLWFLMKDKQVPVNVKLMIMAALGYFILPTDALPDVFPALGFTDDLGVLLLTLSRISGSLTPEIKEKASQKLRSWFPLIDEAELEAVHSKI